MTMTLPEAPMPEVTGVLAKASKGSLSSETPLLPNGMAIKTLEQGMAVAMYLVQGNAAPKGWTPAQVFLAMQAGLEHGLGYTGGIQSFVIINNMPSWRGQAAVGKIRASRVLEPGTLEFGCEEFGEINGQPLSAGGPALDASVTPRPPSGSLPSRRRWTRSSGARETTGRSSSAECSCGGRWAS